MNIQLKGRLEITKQMKKKSTGGKMGVGGGGRKGTDETIGKLEKNKPIGKNRDHDNDFIIDYFKLIISFILLKCNKKACG